MHRCPKWSSPLRDFDQNFVYISQFAMCRDSLVGKATVYGLDGRMIGVRFPAAVGNFSFRHHVQTGSGAHPVWVPGALSVGVKAAGARSWPVGSI
jgi:hypothetical protein